MPPILPLLAAAAPSIFSGISSAIRQRQMNKYNHPAAQMARLKEAGLNPRLVYGQSSGAAAGNMSSPAPEVAAPEITKYQQVQNMQKQNEYLDSQIATQKEEARIKKAQADRLENINDLALGGNEVTSVIGSIDRPFLKGDDIVDRNINSMGQISMYQRQAIEQTLAAINRRYAKDIDNIRNKRYSLERTKKVIDKIAADINVATARGDLFGYEKRTYSGWDDIAKGLGIPDEGRDALWSVIRSFMGVPAHFFK